jgi:hypothetical protein
MKVVLRILSSLPEVPEVRPRLYPNEWMNLVNMVFISLRRQWLDYKA